VKAELEESSEDAAVQVWLDSASGKIEVQSDFAALVSRGVSELNILARAATDALAASGHTESSVRIRTVPCPTHLIISMPRLVRNLAAETSQADMAYHPSARLVAIYGSDDRTVESVAAAVTKMCQIELGCATLEEEQAAEAKEKAAARTKALAEAAKAKFDEKSAAAHGAAAIIANASNHTAKHSHSNNHQQQQHGKQQQQQHENPSTAAVKAAAAAAASTPLKLEQKERATRRMRPPLAPLRTDCDPNHSSGPSSYTSESGSSGRTVGLLDSEDSSPRAGSVSSLSAGAAGAPRGYSCSCASPVVTSLLQQSGNTESLFTEAAAPWAGLHFDAPDASKHDPRGSWDYYRQSWTNTGCSEELIQACGQAHLDLSSVSFVPPPARAHVMTGAGSKSNSSHSSRHHANRHSLLEPGLERAVFELLTALELTKYAPAFGAAEVDMEVLKMLGERELEELGLPKGPRIKMMKALHPQGMIEA
jgi:hypothetical protein